MAVFMAVVVSCELLKKRTLTLMINTIMAVVMAVLLVVNCLKREH